MRIIERLMKLVAKVHDVVELVRRFEASPALAMRELTTLVRDGAKEAVERILEAEIELFLGQEAQAQNKRNGSPPVRSCSRALAVQLRVPRDRAGRFESKVVPAGRRYNEAIEKDMALLHLAGLSTRTLSQNQRAHSGRQYIGPGGIQRAQDHHPSCEGVPGPALDGPPLQVPLCPRHLLLGAAHDRRPGAYVGSDWRRRERP